MDDERREEWLTYFQMVCPECGNLRSECSDPAIDWHPRRSVCYASAATTWGWRKLHERFPAEKREKDGTHRLDGVSLLVSQYALTDEEERAVGVLAPSEPRAQPDP